jgi:transglutaminase superfamily protein
MGTELVTKAGSTATKEAEISTPSVLWCGVLLFAVKVALKTCGLGRTVRLIRRHVEAVPLSHRSVKEALCTTERSVALAGALFPGRARCLEQSLVLYSLLRREGVSVRFVIGVKVDPFGAHAWVDHCGEPINDVAEHVSWYTPLHAGIP